VGQVSEKGLQNYFRHQAKLHGILWRKLKFEGRRGAPDVLVAWGGKMVLVELKNPNKRGRLSKIQELEIERFRAAGVDVRVTDNRGDIDDIIRELADR
jgi:hypothetical protein